MQVRNLKTPNRFEMINFFGSLLQNVLTLKNHLEDVEIQRILGIVLIVLCDLVGVSFYDSPYGENILAVTKKKMKKESASEPRTSSAHESNQKDGADVKRESIKSRLRTSTQEKVSALIVLGELGL